MSRPTDSRGFSVSPVNGEVNAGHDLAPPVFHDTTLREGMQAAPVNFSIADKVEIGCLLDELGIPQIQVGYGLEDRKVIEELKRRGVKALLSVLIPVFRPDWTERLAVASDAGADIFLMLYRSSDEQLALLDRSRAQACDELAEAVSRAKGLGAVSVAGNASFATMADPGFVVELLSAAAAAGAERVGIADSTGITGPEGIAYLVNRVGASVEADVSIHMHNDFGLAVANTLAGWRAGARVTDTSVLGLGERAGNAALEQLVMAVEGVYGVPSGVKLSAVSEVISRISAICNVPIPSNQPVVGEDVFSQKLEMHVQVTAQHPYLHEPFDPATIGGTRHLKLGGGSGETAVVAKLEELGYDLGNADAGELAAWVNEEAAETKSSVLDEAFLEKALALGVVARSGAR